MHRSRKDWIFERRSQIEALVAIADAGSLTAGGHTLEITQSDMSRRLRKLEKTIGARLFERRKNGVRPTIIGAVAIERARVILLEMEAADEAVRRVRDLLEPTESGEGGA